MVYCREPAVHELRGRGSAQGRPAQARDRLHQVRHYQTELLCLSKYCYYGQNTRMSPQYAPYMIWFWINKMFLIKGCKPLLFKFRGFIAPLTPLRHLFTSDNTIKKITYLLYKFGS